MTARELDRDVAALARRQHGAFNRPQVRSLGASSSLIDRRVRSGAWLRMVASVYALPGNPPTWHRQLKVAELSIPGAVVSGTAAAALHQFVGFRRGRPEITVQSTANHRSAISRVRRGDEVEPTVVAGIRTTTIAQTVIDVCGRSPDPVVARAVADVLVERRLHIEALADRYVAVAHRRLPGIAVVRSLLEDYGDGEPPPASELEALLFAALAEAGVCGVVRQHPLPWWPDAPQRVDAFVPSVRALVEADGRRWHTRVADFDRDRWRDNQAVLHHWRPLRYTWFHLTQRRADVLAELRLLAAEPAATGRAA